MLTFIKFEHKLASYPSLIQSMGTRLIHKHVVYVMSILERFNHAFDMPTLNDIKLVA